MSASAKVIGRISEAEPWGQTPVFPDGHGVALSAQNVKDAIGEFYDALVTAQTSADCDFLADMAENFMKAFDVLSRAALLKSEALK